MFFFRAVSFLIVLMASTPVLSEKLVIMSSFPSEMTAIYKQAFEAKTPGLEIEILKRKTSDGLKELDKTKDENKVDIFWVSAPDAFEVLKKKNMLQAYRPQAKGIPRRISGYPVNDPDGFYSGFAAAGYGIMWNREYLQEHELEPPTEWIDLTRPEYQGHIGLSAPSRSGTTHLTVEAILQLKGWEPGWALVKAIAANARTITEKSSQVPKGVVTGEFGIGIVIDYYGLTAKANGEPVEFAYPSATVFVPSGIGVLKKSPRPELAKKFIDFVLSPEGQQLLLHPDISRLPVWPDAYKAENIPVDYPQPFSAKPLGSHTAFDVQKSRLRYNLVNSLFDVMVTYRLDDLQTAVKSLQQAEKMLLIAPDATPDVAAALAQGRDLINYLPVDELTSYDPKFTDKFRKKRKKITDVIAGEQGEIEKRWDTDIQKKYQQAHKSVETNL